MTGSGNGLLVQTDTNSKGRVRALSFGMSGEHGAVTRIGEVEQGSSHQGVSTIRFYLQGSFSTSSSSSGSFGGTLGVNNTSVNATSGYSSSTSGYSSSLYVVSINMEGGCPVAMSTIKLPPGTPIGGALP